MSTLIGNADRTADVVIVGGGLNGVAAAIGVCRAGRQAILTEETDWLGGQLTSQAVPPDEHRWVEKFGVTRSYRTLREGIRNYYRRNYPLLPEVAANPIYNPGEGNVSRLCHEPRVAFAVIDELLNSYRSAGLLEILLEYRPTAVTMHETGVLLELSNVKSVIGAEAKSEFNEPHAAPEAQPLNQQGITFCFAVSHEVGKVHTIPKPEMYEFWRYKPEFWPAPLLSFLAPDPRTLAPTKRYFTPNPGKNQKATRDRELWTFRRILSRGHYPDGTFDSDITIVNWPLNDYWLKPIIGVDAATAERAIYEARQLALCVLYWLQTEAPTSEGGRGFPGLRIRPDVTGTADGLAKAPYIREARRIKAVTTITEHDVSADILGVDGRKHHDDSIGIGMYRNDLHPSTGGDNYIDISSVPFEIPLGSIIPVRVKNLLPAGKNLGSTHVSNGCVRLHPVEWNIGEVAGAVVAHCVNQPFDPCDVQRDSERFAKSAEVLDNDGVERSWPSIHGY